MDSSSLSSFKTKLRNALRGLVFRRTKSVNVGTLIGTYYVEPQVTHPWESRQLISEEKFYGLTPEEREKRTQSEYESYSGYTNANILRNNDEFRGMEIEFTSETNAQFNLEKLSFDEDSASQIPPQAPTYHGDGKVLSVGDLICGWVDPGKKGKNPEYVQWFICSEQFFRAWTLIMYDNHETFSKIYGRPDQMRKRMISGNRLNTNSSYLKWLLGCIHSGVPVSNEELSQHFYVQRTEYISKFTVHTYTSLALWVRYGELPREDNVPNNADSSHKMKEWSLFPGLLENLIFHLTQKRVNLTVVIPDPFEAPLVQEPVQQKTSLIQQLQSLEQTLQQQLYIQQLQHRIWQQEWQLRQQEWSVQQCQWMWMERENRLRWEIQQREQMRQAWEQEQERRCLEEHQNEETIQQLGEILQEGKEEEDVLQEQLVQIQLKKEEPEEELPELVEESEPQSDPEPVEEKKEEPQPQPEPVEEKKEEPQPDPKPVEEKKEEPQPEPVEEKKEEPQPEPEPVEEKKEEPQPQKRWKKNRSQKGRQKMRKEREKMEEQKNKEEEIRKREEKVKLWWEQPIKSFNWADAVENGEQMDYGFVY
jgi:hypothetical protein